MKNTIQPLSTDANLPTMKRRAFARLAMGGAAALALSACGGGGGADSSEGDLDLRAAYDRIVEGMDHEDVDRAVGAKSGDPNNTTRNWSSNGQNLQVNFYKLSNENWTVGAVQWWIPGSGTLTKTF